MSRSSLRRLAAVAAIATVGGLVVPLLDAGAASAASTPTITANVPASLVTGKAPTAFDGTVTNPSNGADYPNVRYDFTLSGISGLKANQVALEYQTGTTTWDQVPLGDSQAGTITGEFGPHNGFDLQPGAAMTTHFRVSIARDAPTGTLQTASDLDNVNANSGDIVQTLATDNDTTTVAAPPAPVLTVNEPTALTVGDAPTNFDGTVNNPADGQDYSNVRYDFTLSGITGLQAKDVTLQYEDTSTSPPTWRDIPLTDNGGGSVSGEFGPHTGFPLPADTTNTTHFRVGINSGAPTGTLTIHNSLDDVSSGSPVPIVSQDQTTVVEAQYVAVTPTRVVDTRNSGDVLNDGPLTGSKHYTLDLSKTSVPLNKSAYVFNVTAVHPSGVGNLAIRSACSDDKSTTSIVNYQAKKDIANDLVVSNLDGNTPCNKLDVYSDTASSNVILDLQGYYTSTSGFTGVSPTRIVDTRIGTGGQTGAVLGDHGTSFQVTGNGGVPSDAKAVAINLTAIQPSGVGNLQVYPDGATLPGTSNVNYVKGVDKAAFAIVQLPANGKIDVYSTHSSVNVAIDVFGYLPAPSTTVTQTPVRVFDSRSSGNGPLVDGTPQTITVGGGNGSVPADAKAVIVSLTAAHVPGGKGVGNLIAYPGGTEQPVVSNINYIGPNTDVANMAIVPLGTGASTGKLTLATQGSSMNAIVDVVGYIPADQPAQLGVNGNK